MMTAAILDDLALDRLFKQARSIHTFTDQPVTDATLHALHDLWKMGPTAFNCQPARVLFIRSAEAKQRLAPALSGSNLAKTMKAPVTAIVAIDNYFFENLPQQFPVTDVGKMFVGNAALTEQFAMRNGTLQGAYLIIAARALGLAAGPMSGFVPAKIDSEFFPDGRWRVNFLINLGYWDGTPPRPRGPRLSFEEQVQVL